MGKEEEIEHTIPCKIRTKGNADHFNCACWCHWTEPVAKLSKHRGEAPEIDGRGVELSRAKHVKDYAENCPGCPVQYKPRHRAIGWGDGIVQV